MTENRLRQQIRFILEIDKLKSVLRRTRLIGEDRHENSAEHSWHLAMMAMVLAEHANARVDALKVLRMVLVHDIVEIDAGDTFCYDPDATVGAQERERRAADRLYGLLPEDQATKLRALWDEFEARETPEAKFAHALDRLMPLLHNFHTQGGSWRRHGVTEAQVQERMAPVEDGSDELYRLVRSIIEDAVDAGYLPAEA